MRSTFWGNGAYQLRTPEPAPDLGPFRACVAANVENILRGTMLVVDPGSSQAGYAIYRKGKLKDCGVIKTEGKHLWQRLRHLKECMRVLPKADLLVIERIDPWNRKTVPGPYMKLLKSIGLFLGVLQYSYMAELSPYLWQLWIDRETYVKADDADAVLMGAVMIRLAEEIEGKKAKTAKSKEPKTVAATSQDANASLASGDAREGGSLALGTTDVVASKEGVDG